MNYRAQKQEISTAVAPLLLEPVPIFYREEAGVRSFGGDAVYIARNMLNIDMDAIAADFSKAPPKQFTDATPSNAKLFPNPAIQQITIQFDDIINSDATIEIYGNLGNIVLTDYIKKGYINKTIDVSKLRAGLYFYSITLNGDKVSSGKLTILNK